MAEEEKTETETVLRDDEPLGPFERAVRAVHPPHPGTCHGGYSEIGKNRFRHATFLQRSERCHHCGLPGRLTKEDGVTKVVGFLMRCKECQVAFYCDGVCQKKAWKVHKALCLRVGVDRRSRAGSEAAVALTRGCATLSLVEEGEKADHPLLTLQRRLILRCVDGVQDVWALSIACTALRARLCAPAAPGEATALATIAMRNVHHYVRPWGFSADALAIALRESNALVAGSFPLQCVRGESFLSGSKDSDIDIYVPESAFALGKFLTAHGYKQEYKPESSDGYSFAFGGGGGPTTHGVEDGTGFDGHGTCEWNLRARYARARPPAQPSPAHNFCCTLLRRFLLWRLESGLPVRYVGADDGCCRQEDGSVARHYWEHGWPARCHCQLRLHFLPDAVGRHGMGGLAPRGCDQQGGHLQRRASRRDQGLLGYRFYVVEGSRPRHQAGALRPAASAA